ncbi:MAG: sodium:proton antiporter [Candidatus Cloacimonetes bacterium HGW-Cloacimonetes-1]|jgi:multicomponent Na+:H+ antiporter subunit B|nr:MAG: sodium:proton antiporter [Candidatus Cloacimonetes bacterium HGW-Cloacimonetes-1]
MIKYLLIAIAIVGMGWMLYPLVADFQTATELNALATEYVNGSMNDLNVPNVVTAVVVTYRGLDTLGEVTVLFLATAGIGFLLRRKGHPTGKRRPGSEILKIGSAFLAPLIVLLGVYIFTHGHLTPGGGFQGGVVIASGMLLLTMAHIDFKFSHTLIHWAESLSGFTYVLIGLLGLLLLGVNSFLDPRFLAGGKWLSLFSAGAVPVIYSFIGLKVGSELSSVIDSLQDGGNEV